MNPSSTLNHTAQAAKPQVPIARLASGLLVSLITLMICLGGIELVGYFWEQNTAQGSLAWPLIASRRLHLERHGTANNSYTLFRPNEDYLWRGIPVHINSRGFRTEELATPKPEGTYRILNLGDSIAFGWEVNQKDTYGKLLEQHLNAQNPAQRTEVINAGVPGWTIQAEHNFLMQEGLAYQPDLVLLDITVVNDIYGGGPGVKEQPSLFEWLRDNTYGWPFFTIQSRLLLSQAKGPEAIPVLNPPRDAASYYPLDEKDPVWDKLWDLIAEMDTALRQQNSRLALVIFPTAFQVNSAAHPNVPQRVLAERAQAAGIPVVDLLPTFQQWCIKHGAQACEGYQNQLFADVWMHPNETGHRLAAEEIAKVLPR